MNALTKVLVVLVLVLSVAFAAAEMVLYRKREDFAAKYRDKSAQLATAQAQFDTTKGELEDTKRQLDQTGAQLREQVQTLDDQLKDEQARARDLNTSLEQERANVGRLTEATQSQQAQLQTLTETRVQLQDRIAELQQTANAKEGTINQLTGIVANKDGTIGDLQQELTEVKTAKAELNEEKEWLAGTIEELREAGIHIPPAPTPAINAVVIRVDGELGTVVIDKGKENEVKANTHFTVYDAQGFVATLVIHDVWDTVAGGRVILMAEGRHLQVGAKATTEIQLD